jgi:LacI family transcriptional regulator
VVGGREFHVASRRSSVTIEHVASAAGVSRQTVSRVINDGPNVKPAVRERILHAIDQLGYVPNLSARRMGGARSYLILAINDRQRTVENWQSGHGNDWVDQMLCGGMLTCEERGYHMLFELVDTDYMVARKQLERALAALQPDGVMLTPPHTENRELSRLLQERGIPYGRIGAKPTSDGINAYMDDAAAAAAATDHLVALGHRRIAFISGSAEYAASDARLTGYRTVLAKAGIGVGEDLIQHGDFSFPSGVAAMERLLALPERPTAVIASNDEMAFAVLHVASAHGLTVPEDLSVISFDDTPGVRFSVPPLTAIRQPIADLAATLCRQLIDAANGGDSIGNHELPYELVVRKSTVSPNA